MLLAAPAMLPDFIYRLGPAHRDWMDVFLFHVSLDEILPLAVAVLAVLWVALLVGYVRFRLLGPGAQQAAAARKTLRPRALGLLLGTAASILVALTALGVAVERSTRTPLIAVGQIAPDFALPSTDGQIHSLSAARGRPVVLGFVPSVVCDVCREQLRAIQEALPELQRRSAVVLVVSTDEASVQQAAADRLGLAYSLLSEDPISGQHPVGSAHGVYHLKEPHAGPVDALAIVLLDAEGVVRAVRLEPGRPATAREILDLVSSL